MTRVRYASTIVVLLSLLSVAPLSADERDRSFSEEQIPLIFPGMRMQGKPIARYDPPAGAEKLELRGPKGEKIEALFCPVLSEDGRKDSSSRPTVIWFYGNAQCIATALGQVEMLRRCGANVLIADYIGYGLSEGTPSESGCYATALALHEHAMGRDDIDRNRIISAGWSLGAAVAIDLASRKPVAGLITFSGYTSKRELARRQFPDVSPEAIEHPFLSQDKIRHITCPTMIVHGKLDTLVPYFMAEELRKSAAGKPLVFLPVEQVGHNDLFFVARDQIESAVTKFLAENASSSN